MHKNHFFLTSRLSRL